MLAIYPPDDGAHALAAALPGVCALPLARADEAALRGAQLCLLLVPDYYSPGCWALKRWLTRCGGALRGKLCSCLALGAPGCGGELALRTLISQLLPLECPLYLCATLCADGRIRPGGSAACDGPGLRIQEYCEKLAQMRGRFMG